MLVGGILIITGDKKSLSTRPQTVISILRDRLSSLQVWPEAGDLFLQLLPVSRWQNSPLTGEDYEWLPRVVGDAISGVDIGSRYPAFFQKLVTSNNLGQSFLDELDRQLDSKYRERRR